MRLAVFIAASAICAACSGRAPAPIVIGRTIEANGATVAVRIALQPEHRALAPRYLDAAEAAVRAAGAWVPIAGQLRLDDPPYRGGAAKAPGAIVLARTPWWSVPTAMAPELAVVRAITGHALATAIDGRRLPAWFMNGLVEYRTRQIVTGLFSRDNTSPGYMMLEPRYFGDFVPRFIRVRLLPESDNEPLTAFRARPSARPDGDDFGALAGKMVAMLDTLQRWLGEPTFESIIVRFLGQHLGAPPTLADFSRIASEASGQDLSWLLAQALASPAVFDYGVADLTTVRAATDRFDTRVSVARFGDALFTGRTAARVGRFESGKGVTIVVTFADGQIIRETWDGRDARKTFVYSSGAPALSAAVDPDRLIALDIRRTNNTVTLAPLTQTASIRWSVRWMTWLQHALLTYASLA